MAQQKAVQDSALAIINQKNTATKEKLNAYIELGASLKNTNAALSLQYLNDGIQLALLHKKENDSTLAALYQYKGEALITSGSRDSGIYYYMKALKIAESKNIAKLKAKLYNNIARFYRQNNPDRAIPFYDKAMAIYESLNDDEGRATILNESGVAYEYKNDLEEAIRRYKASLAIQLQRKDDVGIGYSLEFIAVALMKKDEMAQAKNYLFQALLSRKNTNDTFALAMNYSNIGTLYDSLKSWKQAVAYYDTSNVLAKHLKYLNLLAFNYKELSAVYNTQHQYQKAFEAIELHNLYKDSIFNIDAQRNIEELNTKYETEKQKLTIQQQQFSITKRNYWIAAISLLLLLMISTAYFIFKRNKMKEKARLQNAVMEQQELATKAIIETEEKERQRIARDLHDSVGQMMGAAKINLSVIESELNSNNPTLQKRLSNIINIVDDSVRELRAISHNMMPNGLLKNSLAFAIRDFIDKLDHQSLQIHLYTSGLDKRIDINIETVFYRVIQECVNNVIKHSKANRLDISITNEAECINATIEDNGVGFDANDATKFDGIGLKNIISRVSYLKGSVDFDSAPGRGTVVAIFVPLSPTQGE